MAKLHKPGATVRVEPESESARPADKRIAYLLRVPTVYEKVELKRAAAARGGRQHGQIDLLDALEADLKEAGGTPEDLARAQEAIAARRAALDNVLGALRRGAFDLDAADGKEGWLDALGAADRAGAEVLDALAPQVARAGGRYAELLADNAVYWDILGLEAARLLLAGAEGIPALGGAIVRRREGVPEALLAQIPERHWGEIGLAVQRLLGPTEGEAKNSASPSPTSSTATSSTAPANGHDRDTPSSMPAADPTAGTSPSSA